MHVRIQNVLLALLTVLLLAGVALAGVLLCPRCGYELEPDAIACPHCQHVLPVVTETPSAPGLAAAPVPGSPVLSRAVLDEQWTVVRADLDNDRPALAWLRARNLAGLLTLSPEAAALARPRLELEGKALAAVRSRERPCPACEGKGGVTLLFVNVQGEPSRQPAPGSKCPACEGTGRWRLRPQAASLGMAFAHAQRALQTDMQEKGWSAAGLLWLPPGLPELTVRQRVMALRAVAGPCDSCRGWGMSGCEECDGAGRLACTQDGCVSGRIICPDCKGTRRSQATEQGRTLTQRCPTCRQTGVVECPTCLGHGFLACEACEGRGEQACASCRGTGEKSLCRSCAGEGLRACKRCQGAGTYRDAPCAVCGGLGEALCATCNGTGRGKR